MNRGAPVLGWKAAWRIARRDLNLRFKGLRLLVICLFLGTGALAAIGTLTSAIGQELETQGSQLLGGDIQVSVWQRDLTSQERNALASLGTVSGGTRLQAVARAGDNAAPIELKAVDRRYPLYGTFTLKDGRVAGAPPSTQAWLAQGAADRLGINVGDRFQVGTAELTVGGIIADEPDRLGEGFQLGPTVIVAQKVPAAAGLTQPGAMFRSKYRVAFTDPARDPEATTQELEQQFPAAGFEFRTRDRASPGADRFVGRMGEFLTLVGIGCAGHCRDRHWRRGQILSRCSPSEHSDIEDTWRDEPRHHADLCTADRRGGSFGKRCGSAGRGRRDPDAGRRARWIASGARRVWSSLQLPWSVRSLTEFW